MRNTALHLTNSSSTNQNSKRLVIKNLREPFKPANEDLFGQLWPPLEQAIKAIQHKHSIALSLEILYRHVENLCAAKKESQLYDSLKQVCEEHITDLIPELTKYPFFSKIALNLIFVFSLTYHFFNVCRRLLGILEVVEQPLARSLLSNGHDLSNILAYRSWLRS